jgi:hypothetical protein
MTAITDTPHLVEPSRLAEAERLVREGLLVHLLLGVYLASDVPVLRGTRATALRQALPPRLVGPGTVCREAAAWLWCGGEPPDYLDVVQPPGRGRAAGPGVVLHEATLPPQDTTVLDGLTATTPARTAADLLCTAPANRALAALGLLTTTEGVQPAQIGQCLERMAGVRGVVKARALLTEWRASATR